MKTDLGALNDLLFQELERLTNDDLRGEALQDEIARSKAVTGIAMTVIENGRLVLAAKQHSDEYATAPVKMLEAGE